MAAEPCGCEHEPATEDKVAVNTLCLRHWNEIGVRMEFNEALRWARHGRLDPEEPADKMVIDFFDQLCYWAAKGIGDSGSIGDIYNARARRRDEES